MYVKAKPTAANEQQQARQLAGRGTAGGARAQRVRVFFSRGHGPGSAGDRGGASNAVQVLGQPKDSVHKYQHL